MAIALAALMMNRKFLLWQKPLAIAVAPHDPRASQVDPNAIPLERPKSTQVQSLSHTTTCLLVGEKIPHCTLVRVQWP
jgi:hypothetical protein